MCWLSGNSRSIERALASATKQATELQLDLKTEIIKVDARESEESARSSLTTQLMELNPDFLVQVAAGCVPSGDYFVRTVRMLVDFPRAAWATTWASSQSGGAPYAGFDFAAPLEMADHHRVPIATMRYSAFQDVGGWNESLPEGWRDWDLLLAFEQAGWEGLVAPEWLVELAARYEPRLQTPSHGGERVVRMIVERNQALFQRHGAELWIDELLRPTPVRTDSVVRDSAKGWGRWLTNSLWRRA